MGGEDEEPLAGPGRGVDVLPAFQGEPFADLPGLEAAGGDHVAESGAEVAEALPDQPLPLRGRDLRQGQLHVAQGDLAVPAVEGMRDGAHLSSQSPRRLVSRPKLEGEALSASIPEPAPTPAASSAPSPT